MVFIASVFLAGLAAHSAVALPQTFNKRIAQTIADSTQQWVQACTVAGGAEQCQPISETAFTSLLAAGGNCDQQNAADQMIDLAKQLNNSADMIRTAQIFVQQPRNAPDSLQVPYCQTVPKNAELVGLFHCQFAGSDFTAFSGDQTGNLPLGVAAVNPPGSCPANPAGPIPDGEQLNSITQSPGTPASGSAAPAAASGSSASAAAIESSAVATASGSSATAAAHASGHGHKSNSTLAAREADAATQLQNGKDAIAQNAQFAALSASSSCTAGEQACVAGAFAQCVGSAFSLTQCAGGTVCAALPLLNKAGTSIACTTQADADARIQATGATA